MRLLHVSHIDHQMIQARRSDGRHAIAPCCVGLITYRPAHSIASMNLGCNSTEAKGLRPLSTRPPLSEIQPGSKTPLCRARSLLISPCPMALARSEITG